MTRSRHIVRSVAFLACLVLGSTAALAGDPPTPDTDSSPTHESDIGSASLDVGGALYGSGLSAAASGCTIVDIAALPPMDCTLADGTLQTCHGLIMHPLLGPQCTAWGAHGATPFDALGEPDAAP